eukprot:198072_1
MEPKEELRYMDSLLSGRAALVNVLQKIFNNLRKSPSDAKYRSINTGRVKNKLSDDDVSLQIFVNILLEAGFQFTKSGNCLKFIPGDASEQKLNDVYQLISHHFISTIVKDMEQKPDNSNTYTYLPHCNGCVQSCPSLQRLSNIFVKYTAHNPPNCNDNVTLMLDDYNHMLFTHDGDDEFDHIYNVMHTTCGSKCDIVRRFQCTLDSNNITEITEVKDAIYRELLDKMHCLFMHSYDTGHRVTPMERREIQQTDDEKQITINNHRLRQIITRKQNAHGYRFEHNKYNQIIQTKKDELQMFSFGQLFYYWPCFEHNHNPDVIHPEGYKISDWFITPTYASLRDELIDNPIAPILKQQYDMMREKAKQFLKTRYCRKQLRATHKRIIQQLINIEDKVPNWHCQTEKSGIKHGDLITENHLISVMCYCDYSNLSTLFSATYRRQRYKNNEFETDEDFKARHSNFGWMARYLDEAVNIFSSFLDRSVAHVNGTFYHGMSKEFDLEGVYCGMYQPLSTSSSWIVAQHFSRNDGMILELKSNGSAYFSCKWISRFPKEYELLFVYSSNALIVSNITNIVSNTHSRRYINAIQIIHQVIQGDAYCADRNVLEQYLASSISPLFFGTCEANLVKGAKPIDKDLQNAVHKVIEDELQHKTMEYHQRMFHHVCAEKRLIMMDMELMQIDVCDTSKPRLNGYQGFRFLHHRFCLPKMEMINLQFISALFPNVTDIKIDEMSVITDACVQYILQLVSTPAGEKYRGFFLNLQAKMVVDYQQLVGKYKFRFSRIGWIIMDNDRLRKDCGAMGGAYAAQLEIDVLMKTNSGIQIAKYSHLKSISTQYPHLNPQHIVSTAPPHKLKIKNVSTINDRIKSLSILNLDEDESTISGAQFADIENADKQTFVVSDSDAELLLLIEFEGVINLKSIIFDAIGSPDKEKMSEPKHIGLFKVDSIDKDFDDMQNMIPDVNVVCKREKLKEGQSINVKKKATNSVKFGKLRKLIIYIKSNIDDQQKTYLNGIRFVGNAL